MPLAYYHLHYCHFKFFVNFITSYITYSVISNKHLYNVSLVSHAKQCHVQAKTTQITMFKHHELSTEYWGYRAWLAVFNVRQLISSKLYHSLAAIDNIFSQRQDNSYRYVDSPHVSSQRTKPCRASAWCTEQSDDEASTLHLMK